MKTDLKITKRHQNVAVDGKDGADDDQKRLHYLWRQTVFLSSLVFANSCIITYFTLNLFTSQTHLLGKPLRKPIFIALHNKTDINTSRNFWCARAWH